MFQDGLSGLSFDIESDNFYWNLWSWCYIKTNYKNLMCKKPFKSRCGRLSWRNVSRILGDSRDVWLIKTNYLQFWEYWKSSNLCYRNNRILIKIEIFIYGADKGYPLSPTTDKTLFNPKITLFPLKCYYIDNYLTILWKFQYISGIRQFHHRARKLFFLKTPSPGK